MPSLVLEATWAAAGGSIIIYLAALLSVPAELYDAAEVDGVGIWRKLWHVTLPQLRGVIFVMLILQLIATAQVFLEPFLFTGGGPSNATLTVLLLIYRYAFQNSLGGDYGEATALSLMLAIVLGTVLVALLQAHPEMERQLTAPASAPARVAPAVVAKAARPGVPRARTPKSRPSAASSRRTIGASPGVKTGMGIVHVFLFAGLVVVGLGPLVLLAKFAVTPTADIISAPLAWSPERHRLGEPHAGLGRRRGGQVLLQHDRPRRGIVAVRDRDRDDGRLRAVGAAPARTPRCSTARCSRRCSFPRSCCSFRSIITVVRPAIGPSLLNNYLGVWLPTAANAFLHPAREALLRFASARGVRGGADGWRGTVPPVLVDRAADVEADPRRRLGLRDHRFAEGLPLAVAGADGSGGAAARRPAPRDRSRRPSST